MKVKYLFIVLFLFFIFPYFSTAEEKWWQKWPKHPKGLRISIEDVKYLINKKEKISFVYAGYAGGEGSEVVCGSLIIPYDKVPPNADGHQVKVKFSPDRWLLCF
ncbi:hypothetical protein [Desulfobacula phenolica]|uniref:Uncharacterized protein n=1 Tax=Desulfobacula phenolica TaxID=90732 RepID=A0A1H2EPR1_9BACT|nr:hypothetical protein [Desulfobacula phenolica]SDT96943.1 hypothetical protein SAMN04487931_103267 [Desulfobacula phenolica]